MSFLKRFGKKRGEDGSLPAHSKPISKPDITVIPNSCDPYYQPNSPLESPQHAVDQTWPLPEKVDTGPTKYYWDEQRPLTMILESPEIPSVTSTPQIRNGQPSPRLDFANMGGLLIDHQNGRKAPLRASPVITQHPAYRDPPTMTHPALRQSPAIVQHPGQRESPVVQQMAQQPLLQESPILKQEPHRFRLPKIPPPDADDWTPLTDRFGSKSPEQPKAKTQQVLGAQRPRQLPTPPTTASTVQTNMTGFASTTDTASSPNWVSFSYPKPQQNYSRPREIVSSNNVSSSRTLLESPEITPTPMQRARSKTKRPPRTPEATKLFAQIEGIEDPFKPTVKLRQPSTPPRAPSTPPRQVHRGQQQNYQRQTQQALTRKPSSAKPKLASPKKRPSTHTRKTSGNVRYQQSPRRGAVAPTRLPQPMLNAPPRIRELSSPPRKAASPVRHVASPARRPVSRIYVQQSPRGRVRHTRTASSLSRHSRSRSSLVSLSDTASIMSYGQRARQHGKKRAPSTHSHRKLKKLSALDKRIAAVNIQLKQLEAMHETLRAFSLDTVPENESEDGRSDRNDSVVDDDSKTVSSTSEAEWETVEDASICTRSTRPKRRSRLYAHLHRPSMALSSGMLTYGSSVYDATEAADSVAALPQTNFRASPEKKRSSVLETGLATTMSYSRPAPAVVQLRTASPRKTPRAHRLSRLGHRPQPSAYSFITFKSMASTNNLGTYDYLDDQHYGRLLSETNANCDDDEFEDVLEEVDESYDSDQRPSTAATHQSSFSLFPNQKPGTSNTSLKRYQYWSPEELDRLALTQTKSDHMRSPVRRVPNGHSRNGSRLLDEHIKALTPRKGDATRSPIRRIPNGHARSGSRTLDDSVKAAGNAKFMFGDAKRWMSKVPRRVSYGKKARDDRSNCFSIGKAS